MRCVIAENNESGQLIKHIICKYVILLSVVFDVLNYAITIIVTDFNRHMKYIILTRFIVQLIP